MGLETLPDPKQAKIMNPADPDFQPCLIVVDMSKNLVRPLHYIYFYLLRTGSSVTGELLSVAPRAAFIFEPETRHRSNNLDLTNNDAIKNYMIAAFEKCTVGRP